MRTDDPLGCHGGVRGHRSRSGESRANPNRPTWQQRQMPTAAPSKPGTRGLRFGFARALAQNPATRRGFGARPALRPRKSPKSQTRWRRNQSVANSSPRADPCSIGKIQGNLSISDSPGAIWSKIPQRFRRRSDRFPVIRNREFISMSREIRGNEHGFSRRESSSRTGGPRTISGHSRQCCLTNAAGDGLGVMRIPLGFRVL